MAQFRASYGTIGGKVLCLKGSKRSLPVKFREGEDWDACYRR